MKNLFLDMETYYDNDYSLKKMTPIEYVLDPRFETIGCSFCWEGQHPFWLEDPEIATFLNSLDLSEIRLISHNAMFDMLVLALRYNVHAGAYGCTLSMARNWIRHQTGRVGLKECAKRYGLEKGDAIYNMKGVNLAALKAAPDKYDELVEYGLNDTHICQYLWHEFMNGGFPVGELDVIDWTIRMVVQPALEIDMIRVAEHLAAVKSEKQQLLDVAGLADRSVLMSDEMLAGILIELGVDPPPMKVSPSTNEMIWAFAKTDLEFTALLDHEDPKVQAIVAARLGHRSTIEETRAERFMAISHVTEAMPIPLRYSGAHTHRFSGDWSLNMQNLPNGSKLRDAIRAPKGCVVVSVDASQIEARLNATLSGETWLVEAFKEGRDVYCEFANEIYDREITKADKDERRVGKVSILSLGYGSSWPTFQRMVRNQTGIDLPDDEAARIVTLYRNMNPMIVDHWSEAKEVILMIEEGVDAVWGSLVIEHEALRLPNGNKLRYHDLRQERMDGKKQWVYNQGPMIKRLYGAKVVENECQSLAFLHIAETAMRVKKITDGMLMPCHQIHDELLYCVSEPLAEQVKQLVIREMSRSPKWLPDAPLAAEGHIGETYGGAK